MQLSAAERLGEIAEFMHYLTKVWPRERERVLATLGARCTNCVISERRAPLLEGLCLECKAFQSAQRSSRSSPDLAGEQAAQRQSLQQGLEELFQQHQGKADGCHDALVMFSGGKDSTMLLHLLQQRYPGLRLLAVMIDNGFTSSVAVDNAQRVAGMLDGVDFWTLKPKQSLYTRTFRHALQHLNGEGSYASVERLGGDLGLDLCRSLAASRRIPLVVHGGTREQVERNLGVIGYETNRASELQRRQQVDRFVLADIYEPEELVYWWDGTRWPEHSIPRVIFPFCAWPYDEAQIRREVVRLGYFEQGNEDPLTSNSHLLAVNLALDIRRLGYTSYEPDFARLVREGKADRTSLLLLFQAIEHLATRGAFLPRCIADTLARLQLTHAELGLPPPPLGASAQGGARALSQATRHPSSTGVQVMTAQPNHAEMDDFIRLGGMAPSGGNAQPWLVVPRPGALELRLDPRRASAFLDVGQMASCFAAGCFIENVDLAAAARGWSVDVLVNQHAGPVDALATLRFARQEGRRKDPLLAQIALRHTNRRLHEGPAIEGAVIEQLRQALAGHGDVRLVALSEVRQKREAAAHFGVAEAIFLRHPRLFSEMLSELRWTRAEAERTRDGVALSTLELPGAAVKLLRGLRRWPDLRKLLPRAALQKMPEGPVIGCSHLCALPVRGALSNSTAIAAGRQAQRVWLRATELGLALQPLGALPFMLLRATQFNGDGFDLADCRELQAAGNGLRVLLGLGADEFPLFIFRLSRAAPATDRALRLPHTQLCRAE